MKGFPNFRIADHLGVIPHLHAENLGMGGIGWQAVSV